MFSSFIEDFCRGNSNTFNRSVNNIHEQHLNPHPCGETNIISQFKECPPINASKTPKNEGKGRPKKNNRKKSDGKIN